MLYYHIVSEEDVPHVINLYEYKRTRQFKDDLDFLLKNYSPVKLSHVIDWVSGKHNLPTNCFLMTFDDGFREIHDIIAPILLAKGIPATFFLNSAFIDNQELCYQHKASLLLEQIRTRLSAAAENDIKEILAKSGFIFSQLSEGILGVDYRRRDVLDRIAEIMEVDFREYLNTKQPYLTSGQVKELIAQGFTIGAHSIDHPYYSALALEEQLHQTIVSATFIREKFGLSYGAFAFPHNDTGVPPEFFKKVQQSGLIDITFGTGGMLNGAFHSHRQRISLEKSQVPAEEILKWQYTRKLYKQLKENLKRMERSSPKQGAISGRADLVKKRAIFNQVEKTKHE